MNQFNYYWTISLVSAFIGASSAYFIARYGHKFALIDNPHQRSSHTQPTPRGGGIGILIAFISIGLFFFKGERYQLVFIPGVIGIMGFIEDLFHLSQRLRLIMQVVLSFLSIYPQVHPDIVFLNLFISAFFIVFITGTSNFYNFMDGINGIAGLSGIVGFGLLALFSYYASSEYTITLMSVSLLCACAGFLPLNFPNARVFMGDVGSLLLGFIFAIFVVRLSLNFNIFLCVVMFQCMFYGDALVTIYYRYKKGENLMQPHRRHLYQYLCNELGLPHWKVSLLYAGIQLIAGLVAIYGFTKGLVWQIAVFVVFSMLFMVCYKYIMNMAPRFDIMKRIEKC